MVRNVSTLVGGLLLFCCGDLCAATVIHAARLIDGRNAKAVNEVTIVVEDGRIANVMAGYQSPKEGDRLIKLTEHTVMPGLMDMHTHLM